MPLASGTHTPCVDCARSFDAWLRDRARENQDRTDQLYRRKSTRPNARVNRRMAVAYLWTAEQVRRWLEAGR